jgi:diguanylate cyclase (GGDEF)-like protein/PAS domain S-box-containing protein
MGHHMSSAAQPASRAELARAWADAVSPATEVPLPRNIIEQCLLASVDQLVDALREEPFYPECGADAATALVARGIAGADALARTVDLFGRLLPTLPELSTVGELNSKIPSLLGAFVGGYTAAARQRHLDDRNAWFRAVFEASPVGMVITRLDGTITETNGALTELLYYRPAELCGRELAEIFHPDDAALLRAGYQALVDGKRGRVQRRAKVITGRGDATWVALTVALLRDAEGKATHHLTMVEDIAERQLLEQRVRHQSLHDLMTGLPNRLHFAIHLEEQLERDRNATFMVCKIDLDCFDIVSDGLGISIGDLLLRSVATRLQSLVAGEQAFVARFDADEFAILIKESPSTPNAATLAARINAELSEPVYLAGRGLAVSACVGIVRRAAGETEAKELIRAADATLHRIKRTGRGQWGLYDPRADAADRLRYALATEMPAAWEDGQVSLSYQPLVRLDPEVVDAGQTVALAALLGWRHPKQGEVHHDDCLALAEQTGLVLTVGPWMLRQACEQLRAWRDECGAGSAPIRVDLTAYLTQDPDLVQLVQTTLAETQLEPADLQLGMPVEVIFAGHGDAMDNVVTLAEIGVRTVLTHYGQAVGNLALLESLPVAGVELADPLVRVAAERPDSVVRPALASLVPLIRRTGAAVVVTGIDSTEQADWWRSVGADSGRGAALVG